MPLLARTLHAPIAIEVRRGAVAAIAQTLAEHRIARDGHLVVAVGSGIGPQVSDIVRANLGHAEIISLAGGTLDAALEFGEKLRAGAYEAVVAIGGGKIIDTVKYAASHQGITMMAVATSLAHDGIASPVAVLENRGTTVSYGVHTPIAVMVDLDFVRRSPARQTRSGIGDALSNLNAVADWRLSHEVRGEPLDGLAVSLAQSGAEAVLHHPGGLDDEGLLTALANCLILGGVAMSVAGSSRPCSGGCHEIAHAIDQLYPAAGTHGELVGVGTLFCTFLREDADLLHRLVSAFRRHGLPLSPADLGLSNAQFATAVHHAPSTRPGRFTILEHLALSERQAAAEVERFARLV